MVARKRAKYSHVIDHVTYNCWVPVNVPDTSSDSITLRVVHYQQLHRLALVIRWKIIRFLTYSLEKLNSLDKSPVLYHEPGKPSMDNMDDGSLDAACLHESPQQLLSRLESQDDEAQCRSGLQCSA